MSVPQLLDPHLLLTALEPLLTSGDADHASIAARALSNLLRAAMDSSAGQLLPSALANSREGGIVLGALLALLDHPDWGVTSAAAGALVNVSGGDAAGRRALLQVQQRSIFGCWHAMLGQDWAKHSQQLSLNRPQSVCVEDVCFPSFLPSPSTLAQAGGAGALAALRERCNTQAAGGGDGSDDGGGQQGACSDDQATAAEMARRAAHNLQAGCSGCV